MRFKKKLPVGIDNFEEIRTENFYYVDKTGFIGELLNHWGKVNLFTRPRRFGKSLNMNMLNYFFSYGCNHNLFTGLKIAEDTELCEKYMGKFPVISITLKGISSGKYETARALLCAVIGREALRFQFLAESPQLTDKEKQQYARLTTIGQNEQPGFIMTDDVLEDSLLTLSQLLRKHYHQKVILLIDEYDVPLDKAQQFHYYEEMLHLLRNLLGQVLKGNDSLYFAVLTGCLRIAKESIFTGLNNFLVFSITDVQYDEYFGFLDKEVKAMLEFYGVEDKYQLIKEWYDGYRMGNAELYCPWDVINYCSKLIIEPNSQPKAFWINTSGNTIIKKFLATAKTKTKRELEELINGEFVTKKINHELNYRDLYQNPENFWSMLFATGYLTQRGEAEDEIYHLAIPNLEIRKLFIDQILEWFQKEARKNIVELDAFCSAFSNADVKTAEKLFNSYLQKTISIRDTSVRKEKKENFYHGILLGLLSHREDWSIYSNAESGEGFSDILIEIESKLIGIIIEVKYPDKENLEAGCQKALKQIELMNYAEKLRQDGMITILKYGIACYKKGCKIELGH